MIKELVLNKKFELSLDELIEMAHIKFAQQPPPGPDQPPELPPLEVGPGLGFDARDFIAGLKDKSPEDLAKMRDEFLTQLRQAKEAIHPELLGRFLITHIAHSLKSQNIDPSKFEAMLASMTVGADPKFSRQEIFEVFNKHKDELQQLLGGRQIVPIQNLWTSFLDLWDDLDTPQKIALAVGVPLGLISLAGMLFNGPNFANVLGLAAAAAGGAYALSPQVKLLVNNALGTQDIQRLKPKIAIYIVLRKIFGGAQLKDANPSWRNVYREQIPTVPDVNVDIPNIVYIAFSATNKNDAARRFFSKHPIQAATELRQIINHPEVKPRIAGALAQYGISFDDLNRLSDPELIGIIARVYDELPK